VGGLGVVDRQDGVRVFLWDEAEGEVSWCKRRIADELEEHIRDTSATAGPDFLRKRMESVFHVAEV
jgi:hypothetical protein